jgi:hypothetical protein
MLFVIRLVLLAQACAELDYFGWYLGYNPDLITTSAHTNLFQASEQNDAIAAAALGQSSLLKVIEYFPGLHTPSPDFKTMWEPAVPQLKRLLANKTIIGFNLGDELVWGGVLPKNLVMYADAVRTSFPRGSAVIWYNEACFFSGPRANWKNGANSNVSDYTIPASLDWFSIDQYHMDGPVDGWVDKHPRAWYEQNIYPNMTADQKVILVPGAFGSHVNHYPNGTIVCDNHCYDEMCSKDAADYYAWGKSDPRVVGISPWNWGGCPGCNGSRWTPPDTCCMDEIGAKDQPLTRAAFIQIGNEIKKRLADSRARPASWLD